MPQQSRLELKPVNRVCLTDTAVLEQGLKRAFPLDRAECFEELLTAIDNADKQAEAPLGLPIQVRPSGRRPSSFGP